MLEYFDLDLTYLSTTRLQGQAIQQDIQKYQGFYLPTKIIELELPIDTCSYWPLIPIKSYSKKQRKLWYHHFDDEILKSPAIRELHRCRRPMLETKCVGDGFGPFGHQHTLFLKCPLHPGHQLPCSWLNPQYNESSITQTLLNIIMSDSWRYVNLVMRQT